ncbi:MULTISPECIES: ion transporter [unclassified Flavobacterium]|uniref:ion transporter n=1 Tax=unclassified Flavobacterium TaxID=196869 RepID=UPI00057F90BE|nr:MULTISPECIES: ion transporter [unclassified Flavobacterium]KIA98464.1 ion transporter [Flavobacterium sp. KMS]MEA9412312.1 ion transporter [Flavobacterium sp. PL02]OUL60868.1 ion transporter [Flavobacterium sp. AJR]
MSRIKSKYDLFRQKTQIILYGTNTVLGRLFDLVLLGLILLSVLLVMMDTVEGINQRYHTQLLICEWIITVFFTIEFILRIISIQKPIKYVFSFYGIIDLMAILPMYLSIFFPATNVLTIVRVLRFFRLFKILHIPQISQQSIQLREAMEASKEKILVFIYFVVISAVIIGSLMYVVEGKESGFTSIPMGIYWAIVTLTTVGYGDISPASPIGQFLASLVMIMGYGIIAVPTGIVTAEFAKSSLKSNSISTKKKCLKCNSQVHFDNAKYCYECGETLPDN